MKKNILILLPLCLFQFAYSQLKTPRKYPSLFWEITGNGMTKPSYLFGTMHVSSKLVFHLPDSFYIAIKSVNVVALENNPESWQEDLAKYDMSANMGAYGGLGYWNNYSRVPDDYLSMYSLQFDKYEKQIEQALASRPSTVNNILYRNYSDNTSDFEENTFLDMYIYQVGKKMGKRVAGVESFDKSIKLMFEAYRDAAKDRNRKERNFDRDEYFSPDKLQEAYRKGNLDLLDSIGRLNSFSDAFDEKFLYKRNDLQATCIDSILRSGSALFVGVGAAHLPGNRGVIEILRRMGYKLRPIIMGERDSKQKDLVEKIRVPTNFTTQTADDGFYKVDIPGKFFHFAERAGLPDQLQYADVANGSYYTVARIKTNCHLLGHGADVVKRKVDSVLYENIPGKIILKQGITRNGYKGFDITNLTRRGDNQRYNIFITPYEVLVFKISGNGSYVKEGEEARKFFNSIQLKEYKAGASWVKYQPSFGGFSVNLPHEPFVYKCNNLYDARKGWQYEAEDKATGTYYSVIRTDIHNYHFAEEDSLDLGLLDESFSGSDFIGKQLTRKQTVHKGYPSLDCRYLHKDGSLLMVRHIIQGPYYYTLVAEGKKEHADMQRFISSFEIKPFLYKKDLVEKSDTALYYSVKTSFYPEDKKLKFSLPGNLSGNFYSSEEDEEGGQADGLEMGMYRNDLVENDSTGEKIYVSFHKAGIYYHYTDSTDRDANELVDRSADWRIRNKKIYTLPDQTRVVETQVSDTNSSRLIITKTYRNSRNGIGYMLATEGDTLTAPSSFVSTFFENFRPADTLKGADVLVKKSDIFFNDFFSSDTVVHKRAVKALDDLEVDSTDFPQLKKAIRSLSWKEKKYLDVKKGFIAKLGDIPTKGSADYLKEVYFAAGDTIELQYVALGNLLQHKNRYAYAVFKDIITIDPPVLDEDDSYSYRSVVTRYMGNAYRNHSNSEFWDNLYDSVQLTSEILTDLLPLLNLDDYKWKAMRLLGTMVDSNLVKAKDYELYFSKFLIEAKQELKKQAINEKKKAIEIASNADRKSFRDDDDSEDHGNDNLSLYVKLLLPFYDINVNVPPLFRQLLQSNDKKLKYNTLLLMIKNKRPIPDTMLTYFAAMDDYRYDLYNDLDELGKLNLFPKIYNNQLALAKSKLIGSKNNDKLDSVVYIDRLPAEYKSKQGYIYFFKYKQKKEDMSWKIATAGLIPIDTLRFNFDRSDRYILNRDDNSTDLTDFTEVKITDEEPLGQQLSKHLRKLLYSKRKSAKKFYQERRGGYDFSLRGIND